jgi:hypothetical protein
VKKRLKMFYIRSIKPKTLVGLQQEVLRQANKLVAPLVFDDAPFKTPLTPLLVFLYTLRFPFQCPVNPVGAVLREIRRPWSFCRFPMPGVSTKIDVHLLRLRRAINVSLWTVDQNRELESFTEALPGLIEATHSTRDAHDIVSYLLGQNLFGRLCQSLRSVYDPYRTSPHLYNQVRRTLSSIKLTYPSPTTPFP